MSPTESQARALFSQLRELVKSLERHEKVVEDVKTVVNRVAANSELFVQGYHEYGAEIVALKIKVDKLMAACPNVRPPTDEFSNVDDSEG